MDSDNSRSPLRVQWVVSGLRSGADGAPTSELATSRYRAIIPAQAMVAAGHDVRLSDPGRWDWTAGEKPDAIVLSKLLPMSQEDDFPAFSKRLRSGARQAREAGVPVVADFNDDHFMHPYLGEHWRQTADLADLCVVGSDAMAEVVRKHTRSAIAIIGDPLGSPWNEARVFRAPTGVTRLLGGLIGRKRPTERLRIAWYGSLTNWKPVPAWLDQLAPLARRQPFVVSVITDAHPQVEQFIRKFNAAHGPAALLEHVPWSEETQWAAVAAAHLVILPSDAADPRKSVKTSNRLTDALHAGRYVIASPLRSYQPYGEFATLTQEPLEAVRAYLAEPEAHLRKIVLGQAASAEAASTAAIGQRWADALRQLTSSS